MKEIILNNKNYLLVDLSDLPNPRFFVIQDYKKKKRLEITIDKRNASIFNNKLDFTNYYVSLKKGDYTIIGSVFDILKNEDICKGLVKEGSYMRTYHNYITNDTHKSNQLLTATDSSLSYLQSIDLDMTKEYLLIHKL